MVLFALDIWESHTSVETLQGLLCYKYERTERKKSGRGGGETHFTQRYGRARIRIISQDLMRRERGVARDGKSTEP